METGERQVWLVMVYPVSEELSSVETGEKTKGVPKRAEVSEELSSVETLI